MAAYLRTEGMKSGSVKGTTHAKISQIICICTLGIQDTYSLNYG